MGTYRITETDGIATLAIAGEPSAEDGVRILREAASRIEAGAPLLIDIRAARSPALSFKDTYGFAQIAAELAEAFRGRIAVLDGFDDQFEKTQFFEASATVKGLEVRAFVSEAAALRWLQEDR